MSGVVLFPGVNGVRRGMLPSMMIGGKRSRSRVRVFFSHFDLGLGMISALRRLHLLVVEVVLAAALLDLLLHCTQLAYGARLPPTPLGTLNRLPREILDRITRDVFLQENRVPASTRFNLVGGDIDHQEVPQELESQRQQQPPPPRQPPPQHREPSGIASFRTLSRPWKEVADGTLGWLVRVARVCRPAPFLRQLRAGHLDLDLLMSFERERMRNHCLRRIGRELQRNPVGSGGSGVGVGGVGAGGVGGADGAGTSAGSFVNTVSLTEDWTRTDLLVTVLEALAPHLTSLHIGCRKPFPPGSLDRVFSRFTDKLRHLSLNLKAFGYALDGNQEGAASSGYPSSSLSSSLSLSSPSTSPSTSPYENQQLHPMWKVLRTIPLGEVTLHGFQGVPASQRAPLLATILASSTRSLRTLTLDTVAVAVVDRYLDDLVAVVFSMQNLAHLKILCDRGVLVANALAKWVVSRAALASITTFGASTTISPRPLHRLRSLIVDDGAFHQNDHLHQQQQHHDEAEEEEEEQEPSQPLEALSADFAHVLFHMENDDNGEGGDRLRVPAYVGLYFAAWLDQFAANLAQHARTAHRFFRGNLLLAMGGHGMTLTPVTYRHLWEASAHAELDLAEGDSEHMQAYLSFHRRRELVLYRDPEWEGCLESLLEAISMDVPVLASPSLLAPSPSSSSLHHPSHHNNHHPNHPNHPHQDNPFHTMTTQDLYQQAYLWEEERAVHALKQLPNLRTVRFTVANHGHEWDLELGVELVSRLPWIEEILIDCDLSLVSPRTIQNVLGYLVSSTPRLRRVKILASLNLETSKHVAMLWDMRCNAPRLPFEFQLARLVPPMFQRELSYLDRDDGDHVEDDFACPRLPAAEAMVF